MISSRKTVQPPWIAVGHDEGVGEDWDVLALRALYGNTYEPVSMLGDWPEPQRCRSALSRGFSASRRRAAAACRSTAGSNFEQTAKQVHA